MLHLLRFSTLHVSEKPSIKLKTRLFSAGRCFGSAAGVWIVSACVLIPMHAMADADEPAPVPEPPELPMPVQSGEEMEPDITIIRKGKETVQEYRRNGRIYMIKVQPQIGPAYYMLDTNGDGQMDVKKSDIDKHSNINLWTLFEWD